MLRIGIRLVIVLSLILGAALAKDKGEYVSLDAGRSVEITHDGKVLHVSATDTTGKTHCSVFSLINPKTGLSKGFGIVCME